MRERRYPKFRVVRELPTGETEQVLWPEGEPAWRHGPDSDRALIQAIRDANELLGTDEFADTLLVVDDTGAVLDRVEPLVEVPF